MAEPFTFHTDPGHGWVEVPYAMLVDLGIEHKISSYSYRKGDACYLEEDCDACVFMNAFVAKHGYEGKIVEQYRERTPIRSYGRYHVDPGTPGKVIPADGVSHDD